MSIEQAKRNSEQISGVSNTAYDLVAILHKKLEAIAALEVYKQDASGDQEVTQLFDQLQRQDKEVVSKLKGMINSRLK